jgi:hypothetical protein
VGLAWAISPVPAGDATGFGHALTAETRLRQCSAAAGAEDAENGFVGATSPSPTQRHDFSPRRNTENSILLGFQATPSKTPRLPCLS